MKEVGPLSSLPKQAASESGSNRMARSLAGLTKCNSCSERFETFSRAMAF